MKNKKYASVAVALVSLLTITACDVTIEGACEHYYSNYSSTGSSRYSCIDVDDSGTSLNPPTAADACFYGDDNYLHKGKTCTEIGYTDIWGSGSYGNKYRYDASYNQSPQGHSGLGMTSSSSGGGGTNYNCDTVWTGDPNDIQVSTQCQTACVYYNAGSQQGGDSACSIVAGWGATSSCTVCN